MSNKALNMTPMPRLEIPRHVCRPNVPTIGLSVLAPPLVSVVIPTYRRPRLLMQCLSALFDQSLAGERYEIIVCDDDADSEIQALLARLSAFEGTAPLLRYIAVTASQGPAGARNAGWKKARAPVVAFTDDDTLPDAMWLEQGLQAMTHNVDALGGRIVMPLPERLTDMERDASGLQHADFVTANCFVRYDALQAVGGFDERYRQAWREDSDLHFSLLEQGFRIERAEQAVVVHPLRPCSFAAGLGMQRKAMFDVLLYRKHPHHYRERVRKRMPVFYLLITLSLLAVPLFILVDLYSLAIMAGMGWLFATLTLFFFRLRGTILNMRNIAELAITSTLNPLLATFWRAVGWIRFREVTP